MNTDTINTHELFLHIAEWLDALTAKDIKSAQTWAKASAEGSSISEAQYEQRYMSILTVYKIDDHPRSKYLRIVASQSKDTNCGQDFVHAFVDRATGSVYKPAGWKAPAKGKDGKPAERYNLMNSESRAKLLERCEFTGGYLYADRAK
jgi:hypothetical protein